MRENQIINNVEEKTALQKFGEKINAMPLWLKIVIVVACCALDTVTCVLLLVGSIIFMKAGSKGMALALACCNIVIPDMLPLVDEVFTVIVVVIPVYKEYKATGSIFKSVKAGVQSHQNYKNLSEEVVNGNIQALNDDQYNEDVNTYQDELPENSNITTQIKELNQLKLDGIITEDEFNQKKSELMSKL